jgi:desulfoferrodoxin (superoxide reductase-like protein)
MTMLLPRRFLLLSMTLSLAIGFQLHPLTPPKNVNNGLLGSRSHDFEVSRRRAILTTTTTATTACAMAFGGAPAATAALGASALFLKLQSLETENADTVNGSGAPEKHLPQVTVVSNNNSNSNVNVVVPHVMDPEKPHFIEYIWLKDMKSIEIVASKAFKATDPSPPTLTTMVAKGTTIKPLLYCNLHGLWEGQVVTV